MEISESEAPSGEGWTITIMGRAHEIVEPEQKLRLSRPPIRRRPPPDQSVAGGEPGTCHLTPEDGDLVARDRDLDVLGIRRSQRAHRRRRARGVLARIKTDDLLRSTAIVVLSTSCDPGDILRSDEPHATKAINLDELSATVHQIDEFFTSIAALSPSTSAA